MDPPAGEILTLPTLRRMDILYPTATWIRNMHPPVLLIALATWSVAATAAAQSSPRALRGDPATPVSAAVRSAAARAATNFIAAAERMPPGSYGFKPTPAQMSF